MQLTQQLKIFPTPAQGELLWKLSEKCRLIYNFALAERRDAWKHGIKSVNYTKQQNDSPKIKEQYPEYKCVYSEVLQYVLRTLDADYKSFFALQKNGHKVAQPKVKRKFPLSVLRKGSEDSQETPADRWGVVHIITLRID